MNVVSIPNQPEITTPTKERLFPYAKKPPKARIVPPGIVQPRGVVSNKIVAKTKG